MADGGVGAAAPPDAGQPVSPEDEKLLKEIEAAQASPPKGAPQAGAAQVAPAQAAADKGGVAGAVAAFTNIFNPAMSFNGLFLGSLTSEEHPAPDQVQTGLAVQELEMQLLANVDPYLSANMILSLPNGEGIGLEEGYLSVTPQPLGLSFRLGKLKVPFGRENMTHTHALPFVDKSLVGTAVFGEEGLSEVGAEATYLVPVPWYLLATLSVFNGDNEVAFNSPNGRDLLGFAALKNVFDLTDDTTLEAGASYAVGNNMDRLLSQVAGAHLVLKWKPARASTTESAVVTFEGLYSHVPRTGVLSGPQTDTYGFYSYAQWQLAKRWFVGGRFDYLRPEGVDPGVALRESAILVFVPTEFSAFRLQGSAYQPGQGAAPIYEAFLQVNFTLGSHPAHSY